MGTDNPYQGDGFLKLILSHFSHLIFLCSPPMMIVANGNDGTVHQVPLGNFNLGGGNLGGSGGGMNMNMNMNNMNVPGLTK